MSTACEALTARFEKMKQAGLVDVKMFFSNTEEVTKEAVCTEVNAMLSAYESGECVEFEFNDSRR